jgi:hypothetical protein
MRRYKMSNWKLQLKEKSAEVEVKKLPREKHEKMVHIDARYWDEEGELIYVYSERVKLKELAEREKILNSSVLHYGWGISTKNSRPSFDRKVIFDGQENEFFEDEKKRIRSIFGANF